MKRWFCDFCDTEIGAHGGDSVFDQETYLAGATTGRSIVVRIDIRKDKDKGATHELSRPDVCVNCRDKAVAQALGLQLSQEEG